MLSGPPGSAGQADGGAPYNLAFGNKIEDGTASIATVTIRNSSLANSIGGNDLINDKRDGSQTNTATVNYCTTTITAPPAVQVSTGTSATACSLVVSDATLGTATGSDNCGGSMTIVRSGVPVGNLFPVGTTTVAYTATDAAGNTQTATQAVSACQATCQSSATGTATA